MLSAGDILIAKPFLHDGYFKRSVILVGEHNEEGSLGFVLNRPQGLLLRDIFPHIKNGNFPLFEGGPVSTNQLFYTHTLGEKLKDSQHVVEDVYWGGDFYELTYMLEHGEVSADQIRFYIGYSGWGKEQLDEELKADTWFAAKTSYGALIRTVPDDIWGIELGKINPGFKAFSDFAFDPSLN